MFLFKSLVDEIIPLCYVICVEVLRLKSLVTNKKVVSIEKAILFECNTMITNCVCLKTNIL